MKKSLQGIVLFFAGIGIGIQLTKRILSKPMRKAQENSAKFQQLFQIMSEWVRWKQKGVSLSGFFEKHGYRSVAIYGIDTAGLALYEELKGTDVQVRYAIDKNKEGIAGEIEVYSPNDSLPDVDVIVVSAVAYYEEVAELMKEKMDCAVLSLEDVVCDYGEK